MGSRHTYSGRCGPLTVEGVKKSKMVAEPSTFLDGPLTIVTNISLQTLCFIPDVTSRVVMGIKCVTLNRVLGVTALTCFDHMILVTRLRTRLQVKQRKKLTY